MSVRTFVCVIIIHRKTNVPMVTGIIVRCNGKMKNVKI